MFIVTRLFTFTAPEERNVYGAFSCAPTELGLVCDRCSYKHSAPPELTPLVAALPLRNLRMVLHDYKFRIPGRWQQGGERRARFEGGIYLGACWSKSTYGTQPRTRRHRRCISQRTEEEGEQLLIANCE